MVNQDKREFDQQQYSRHFGIAYFEMIFPILGGYLVQKFWYFCSDTEVPKITILPPSLCASLRQVAKFSL